MPSTISGVIDIVRARLDFSGLSDLEMLDLINDEQRRILRQYPFLSFEGRSSGTLVAANPQTFALPSDFAVATAFFIYTATGAPALVPGISYAEGLESYASAATQAVPARLAFYGTVGYLFPALQANAPYLMLYQSQPADFATITATNALLQKAPEVLNYATVAGAYEATGEIKLSAVMRAKAADAVKALIRQTINARETYRSAIPVTPGGAPQR
jgi:hypothetical protein